jgi:ribonuclease-3
MSRAAAAALAALEERLGHAFADPRLLQQALVHPSIATPGRPSNQRLEFLGDRVLGLVIAEALVAADARANEGQLAPRFNALVRRETCAKVAEALGLGAALRLGRSEMLAGGRRNPATLADAMEAVLAAVYLDGGLEAARAVILRHWAPWLAEADRVGRDPKTELQERVQGAGAATPVYAEIAREGPAHAPVFTVEVRLADGRSARGTAPSKRAAEQAAAAALLAGMDGEGAGAPGPRPPSA